jgi:hypothetical protein
MKDVRMRETTRDKCVGSSRNSSIVQKVSIHESSHRRNLPREKYERVHAYESIDSLLSMREGAPPVSQISYKTASCDSFGPRGSIN